MPGKVRVKLLAARNLPIMDRASEACDAFGEVKLGNTCFKTEICKKSLNPQWNSDWFRFEVDDEELQDEPLQIRIMDYDTYSANDAIGKVYIDLNPLLGKDVGSTLSGWLPIYDTMHGIRGEVNLVVRIDLFSDSNRYRESSCGVRFFYSSGIPQGYHAHAILGFVEELVVNDDPEYKWIDKIRTPRASNEARQTLFSKLSGEVQRRIGHKALELGGNAVVAYRQCFDLEGESGVVVRGIGTAVTLVRIGHSLTLSPLKEAVREELPLPPLLPPSLQRPPPSPLVVRCHARMPSSPAWLCTAAPLVRVSPGSPHGGSSRRGTPSPRGAGLLASAQSLLQGAAALLPPTPLGAPLRRNRSDTLCPPPRSPSEESPPHPLPSPPRMIPVAALSSIPLQRASDPDLHTAGPAATALSASSGSSTGGGPRQFINRPALARESLEMLAERKAVNKYYPPEWTPGHGSINKFRNSHPLRDRARKLHLGILVIRFEMPYNIWCDGCGNHIGTGVRYNAEKSKVGMYYSTPIYKFRMKCHLCDNHFEIKTDPQNMDYEIISGARRQERRWDPSEMSKLRQMELGCGRHGVDLTSLDHVPGGKIEKYLGNLDFFFIREGTSIREEGGLNGFVQGFMTEILAIVRAHVASLGGNAVVAFQMTQCILLHNPHKNQGQCLINVAGDAVLIHYHSQIPDAEPSENTLSPC
ncbi:C2 domain-containing protein 5-like [Dermacentor silvarum]|uniref:C2 domain-containing protein 5-like n=1 Tax=Dermacentor silvarum TaxID=543639 RepID=UPI001897F514|nr:C2 domain-containing protein 5-like [Dermacentor silvarum]